MWCTELQVALSEIFNLYGLMCCINKIENNRIYMSNFDVWVVGYEGHIYREEENE